MQTKLVEESWGEEGCMRFLNTRALQGTGQPAALDTYFVDLGPGCQPIYKKRGGKIQTFYSSGLTANSQPRNGALLNKYNLCNLAGKETGKYMLDLTYLNPKP